MKLSVKIGIGFGLVLLISAVVGLAGWRGLSNVMEIVAIDDLGQKCTVALNGCATARRDFARYGFAETGRDRKTAPERWQTSYEQLRAHLTSLGAQVGLTAEYRQMIAGALTASDAYKQAFAEQLAGRRNKDAAFGAWRELGFKITGEIDAANSIMLPLRDAAEARRDLASYSRWNRMSEQLSLAVVEPFLLLRISAIYLVVTNADAEWNNYQTQLKKARDGVASWQALVRGDARLEAAGQRTAAQLAAYEAAGEQYHQGILAERKAEDDMAESANNIVALIEQLAHALREDMRAMAAQANLLMLLVTLIAIAIGITLAVVLTRGIVRPINRVIENLGAGADQTASAATQVSSASQSLAQAASEQAASVEESSSSMEEIASMTRQNGGNAQHASALMNETAGRVEKGQESMGKLTSAIEAIKKSSNETAKIVKTIDEIAFQTNLLALNAAVEAARAGEAGRGFSVVAEEVRNLAQRSAEAARNTAELIDSSVRDAENGVAVTRESVEALGAITQAAEKVKHLVNEIAAASQEQTQGLDQVNQAIGQMDTITQQNAAYAEESASAAEELNAQTEQLRSMVADLHLLVGGSLEHRAPAVEHLTAVSHKALGAAAAGPYRKREGRPQLTTPVSARRHRGDAPKPATDVHHNGAGGGDSFPLDAAEDQEVLAKF